MTWMRSEGRSWKYGPRGCQRMRIRRCVQMRDTGGNIVNRAERRRFEKENIKKPVYYQYTLEQIEAIKRQAVQEKKDELKIAIAKELDERIQKEWEEREAALSGETEEERMLKVLALLMSVPAKVLCEKFHWKPITSEDDRRSRLLQFSIAVVDEVNRICSDDNSDVRAFVQEAYEKYGVKYEVK